ncbi:gamma-glutamyltranspeptidase precursor [Gemmatimonas aurantiaca T-27]|uniref:Gamma-glutamyltranspeptidase n=2 Tax=Gemmatimonas aurantiaca TaxID=173480 RepID=C1AAF9_GEMAT|nr:gamma-glutamyltransferase [Gemmatimonas aurantiaca]BAH39757.1 gamma-glutamyltranspeptidase precursor [Gemmatimonas aurantiaca T-27]
MSRRVLSLALCAGALTSACAKPAGEGAVAPMAGKRVEGRSGMVAASHPDAAAAGDEVLRQGGNAIDAFVATAFALSVTDVSQTGLGGGGAMTFYDAKQKRVEHLSFYPRTGGDPAWGQADTTRGRSMGRAAATPGMVAGLLEAHGKWGKLTRAQVMAPAIRLARDGFIVSPLLARTIVSSRTKLTADSLAMARFMPRGEALRPGDRLVQPELASTLERIQSDGRDGFYRGSVAERLSAKVKSLGGLISVADMNSYPVMTMRPLCATWHGYTVLGAPPPMGGSAVLEMLQIAEQSGVNGSFTNTPESVVKMADILRIAGADANRWRGDPQVMRVPARGVATSGFARQRAGLVGGVLPDTAVAGDAWAFDSTSVQGACTRFDPYPAVPATQSAPGDDAASQDAVVYDEQHMQSFTSHLSVVDSDGSAVSATTTVGVLFGSGVYTDGFFLNSSGSNFDARTRGTHRYANSTMSPTMLLQGDKVRLVIGAAGSQYIQPAITQVTLRMLAFGEDPWIAIAAPRIYASAVQKEVEVEAGFAAPVYQALVLRGYRPVSRVADITFGGVHAVYVAPDGRRIGVADPRRDGVAAGH